MNGRWKTGPFHSRIGENIELWHGIKVPSRGTLVSRGKLLQTPMPTQQSFATGKSSTVNNAGWICPHSFFYFFFLSFLSFFLSLFDIYLNDTDSKVKVAFITLQFVVNGLWRENSFNLAQIFVFINWGFFCDSISIKFEIKNLSNQWL